VIDGDVEGGSLMAGQSVGMVTSEQPTATILEELVGQAVRALAARSTGQHSAAQPGAD
jgi:enoyl-[acyl-carrier protein] reductase II